MGVVGGRVPPARHRRRRDRRDSVRRVEERRDRVRGDALRHHRHQHPVRGEHGQEAPLECGVEVAVVPGRGQDLADRVHVQGGCQGDRVRTRPRLVHEAEADPRHACQLLVVARLDALFADEVEVREHRGDDLVPMVEPVLGGLDGDPERREVPMSQAGPCAQAFRPPARLQRREQAAGALVAEEVRDERERASPVVRPQRRDREREGDGPHLAHRLDVEPRGQAAVRVERNGDAWPLDVATRHLRKSLPHHAFEHCERLVADHHELHQVRRIVALVEGDQLVADVGTRAIREGLRIPHQEPREGMARVEGLPPGGEASKPIIAQPRHVLGVHDLAFALDVLPVEPRGDEELGEAVERAFEMGGVDVEEVARVGEGRSGVARAAVLGDETAVLARVRILPGTEKEHVLEKVRESRALVRIVGAAHVDVERGRRLVGVRIGHDQGFESVVEHERAVGPGIGGTALDLDPTGVGRCVAVPGAVRRRGNCEQEDEHPCGRAASSESHGEMDCSRRQLAGLDRHRRCVVR